VKFIYLFALIMFANTPASSENVTHTHLADEINFPFLFNGQPSRQLPNGAGYSESISRFPDLSSCQNASGQSVQSAARDTIRIDWKATKTTKDVDVCVFRALIAIHDFARGRKWLEEQGFEVYAAHSYVTRQVITGLSSAKWLTFGTEMNKLKFRDVFGLKISPLQFHALRGVSMQISVDEFAYPQSVQLTLNFE
jgi:hypothetical protein